MLDPGEEGGGEDGLLVVLPAEVDVFLVDLDEDSTRGETKGRNDGLNLGFPEESEDGGSGDGGILWAGILRSLGVTHVGNGLQDLDLEFVRQACIFGDHHAGVEKKEISVRMFIVIITAFEANQAFGGQYSSGQ